MFNQLGSYTANKVQCIGIDFDLNDPLAGSAEAISQLTGFNTPTAPTYKYYPGQSAYAGDQLVVSTDKLSWKDVGIAVVNLMQDIKGRRKFEMFGTTKGYMLALIVGYSGFEDLKNEARSNGNMITVADTYYSTLNGGKTFNFSNFVCDNVRVIRVPDTLIPRGVHSSTSAPVTNVRRALLVGQGALDLSFGAGYSNGSETVRGFNITVDDTFKKGNDQEFQISKLMWGCKKRAITGTDSNSSTYFDAAVAVLPYFSTI